MKKHNIPAQMVSVGFQQILQTNSTAQGLNTTCAAGRMFNLSVETQSARYRADGTLPTANTGVLISSGENTWLFDVPGSSLKFYRAAGGTSKISIMAYRYVGD